MLRILLTVFFIGFFIQKSEAQTSISEEPFCVGKDVTLKCNLSGTFTYPVWRGPPSLIKYTFQDDATETINSNAPAAKRLRYASNKRDLILSEAEKNDSSDYQCSYALLGSHTITLTKLAGCSGICIVLAILSAVFGGLGICVEIGLVLDLFFVKKLKKYEKVWFATFGICAFLMILSLVLGIVVLILHCEAECCGDWIDQLATAFIVISVLGLVVLIVVGLLVKKGVIPQGGNADKGKTPPETQEMTNTTL